VYRTVYTYDHMGNLTDEWFYRDHESEIEYENHIQYLHDDQGILLRETHMDLTGSTTHRWDYAYMASDKPTTQTLYRGRSDKVVSSFHYSYDSRGNLIAKAHLDYDRHNTEKDDIGCSKQSFKYSSSGQITESKHDTGCDESIERCQTNEYDSKDRLVREVHYKGECGEVEVWFAYSYESFDEYGNPGERIKD